MTHHNSIPNLKIVGNAARGNAGAVNDLYYTTRQNQKPLQPMALENVPKTTTASASAIRIDLNKIIGTRSRSGISSYQGFGSNGPSSRTLS